MGSPAIAGLIAHAAFWALLLCGWATDSLGFRSAAIFLSLWLAGFLGLPYLPGGGAFFSSYIALLDIVLVFLILKGDVRLT